MIPHNTDFIRCHNIRVIIFYCFEFDEKKSKYVCNWITKELYDKNGYLSELIYNSMNDTTVNREKYSCILNHDGSLAKIISVTAYKDDRDKYFESYEYIASGKITRIFNPGGLAEEYFYNSRHQLFLQVRYVPKERSIFYEYNEDGQCVTAYKFDRFMQHYATIEKKYKDALLAEELYFYLKGNEYSKYIYECDNEGKKIKETHISDPKKKPEIRLFRYKYY